MLRLNSLQLGGRGGSKEGRGETSWPSRPPAPQSRSPWPQLNTTWTPTPRSVFGGHGHLDVESLLSSITHLRCVQASQNADNDHGAPGYAGAASSFVYRCQISEKYSSAVDRVSQCTLYYPRMHNFVHFLTTTY